MVDLDRIRGLFGCDSFQGIDHAIERTVETGAPHLELGADMPAVTRTHLGARRRVE